MRSLSESTKGNNTITNKERLVNESQQQEINNLVNEVDSIKDDIQEINDTLNEPVINKSAANFTGTVSAGTVHSVDSEFTNVSAANVEATNIDATNVDADEIDVGRIEATTAIATNATVTNATIANADITDANITNFNVDNFTADEITAEDITADDIVVNNSISADVANIPTVNATDIDTVTLDATTVNGTNVNATDLSATYGDVNTLGNQILKSKFIEHDDYYIDINQVVSDTDFIVIELPNIKTGDYRLTYYNSQMTDILFSFALNDTKENKWFSYSRALDQKSFDQVAIKDGKLYIKTWYTGRLYFHSDTLDNIIAPKTYAEWPIDIEDLDYPLFTATRIKATVYTHFVNIGMDDQEYGTAVFSYNTTNNWDLVKDQLENANPIEYDPQTDVLAYNYIPDQNVNVDSDVEFGDVEADNIKINGTVGHTGLEISNIENGQILRKRSTDTQMTAENPVDVDTDDQPLSRLSDGILTERTVANWNGATNRQYSPGTDPDSFTAVFSERDINDPEDYGTKTATSVNNVYKLTSNGNETYYKEVANAQVSAELEANDSIVKADFDNFIANTPANYSYHLDAEVDSVKFYTLLNTSGTVAFAYDDGVNVYGTNYIGQSYDRVFETLGLTKSTDYESLVSSEWDTSDFVVDIVYIANAYDYLDKYWGVNNVFPKGTGQNIDGALVSSAATENGATFYYSEYQYIPTATEYNGPNAQSCTIDAQGNVTPFTGDLYSYERYGVLPDGDTTTSTYTHTVDKYWNTGRSVPVSTSTLEGDIESSRFDQNSLPTGATRTERSLVYGKWRTIFNDGEQHSSYDQYLWHGTRVGFKWKLGQSKVVDIQHEMGFHLKYWDFDNSTYGVNFVDGPYRQSLQPVSDNDFNVSHAFNLTVDNITSEDTYKYIYVLYDGSKTNPYVYSIRNARDDSAFTGADYDSAVFDGGSSATNPVLDNISTYSYTEPLTLENNNNVQLYAYVENTNGISYRAKYWRQTRDICYEYIYEGTVTTWAVYWEADLGSGHDFYEDEGAVGNKYIFLNDGNPIPNPLSGGYNYNGGRVNITGHDRLITFKIKPYSVTVDTLDFNLVDKVLPTVSDPVYSSSITHVGKIIEGEWDAGPVKADGDITSTGNLSVAGNAEIGGDLNVAGTITTVHSEEVTTEENTIELRHDAQVGLIGNETSGLIVNNYDGNNNDAGILLDSSGTLRIGDIGDTEPVATRDESANLTNDNLLKWDASGNRLVDSGKSLDDIADDIEAAKAEISEINGWSEYLERVNPSSAPTNITQIATQVQNYMTTLGCDCIVFKALMTVAQCSTYLGLTFSGPKILVYTCDKSSGTTMNAATLSAANGDYLYFNRYDFTNNVWTPAFRINELNLMSTGVNTHSGTSYGALKVGPETAPHIEMGLDPDDNTMMRIYSKTANNAANGAPLKISGEYVWVPNVLRIPTNRPSNLQPGMIWVSI